jgi:pectate lyase-like protein
MLRLSICATMLLAAAPVLAQSPTALVFDVVEYGAVGSSCEGDTEAIQSAIEAAKVAGGTVYFPPGTYCLSDELRGYPNVTLRGASLGGLDGTSASRLQTSPTFGPNMAMIRVNDRNADNYGFQVEDLTLQAYSAEDGIVGVDFSGVWYGAIRGVDVVGAVLTSPRRVQSAGSIGFLFSDTDGPAPGRACFSNLVERTSVYAMETGYRFSSTQGNTALQTVTSFWASDVKYGVWTSSIGNIGQSFRDGYMTTTLEVEGKKAFKHTAGNADINAVGVYFTSFDAPNDARVSNGGLTALGWIPVILSGRIVADGTKPLLSAGAGTNCGATSDCPCRPNAHPPAGSQSFWATIPSGTTLTAGENPFSYYTYYSYQPGQPAGPVADLFLSFHPKTTGGIGQLFRFSGTNSPTQPFPGPDGSGAWFTTYNVKIHVNQAVQLTSDLIFFLQGNVTLPSAQPASCLYPPSIP